jgi:hypothetical protein
MDGDKATLRFGWTKRFCCERSTANIATDPILMLSNVGSA